MVRRDAQTIDFSDEKSGYGQLEGDEQSFLTYQARQPQRHSGEPSTNMGPSCEFSLNEEHVTRQKLESLRSKYRQLWDKVNKYKRKVKKQSQEKRELREIIAELE